MRAKVSPTGRNLVSRPSKTDRERAVGTLMMPSSSSPDATTLQFEVFRQERGRGAGSLRRRRASVRFTRF